MTSTREGRGSNLKGGQNGREEIEEKEGGSAKHSAFRGEGTCCTRSGKSK